jgi:hypothetical protein
MAIQKITSGIIQDGAVAAADIVSVSNTAISGLIQAAQIGSANATLVTSGTLPAAVLPAGSVLQVVQGTYATSVTNSTNVYADTGLTATITPTSASSKILVLVNQAGVNKANNTYIALYLYRGASSLTQFEGEGGYTNTTATNSIGSCSICYLDSPATTSATTYTTYFKSVANAASVAVQGSSATSTITLMEIAA